MSRIRTHWSQGWPGQVFLLIVDTLVLFDACALGYLCRFQWGFPIAARWSRWSVR